MIKVAGVRFKNAGKVYYFDPDQLEVKLHDNVIVETARGLEFGTVTMEVTEVRDEDVVQPLKKIIRIAGAEDIKHHEENEKKKARALKLCQEKINKHGLEMKLIDVEYTFDNNKIIFYFTADGRVDFRELVKDLASVFKMRIELRQIGVRDEAKMMGGIGSCGKSLCCSTWLSDFEPVSIKMAKVQNLSLNPNKISGICGRLMCCLKYENEVYMELRKGLPDNGEKVRTKDGMGKVVETNILGSKVKVRLYTGEKDDDGEEKLGTEIYTYKKEEIKRLGQHKKNNSHNTKNILEEVDKEYVDELKKMIKE
ncbi:MAG: stage 0 sporulation family protein [Anaerovoracaceae bacterium]